MPIFPYTLIRMAGLPFEMLEKYRTMTDIFQGYEQLQQDIQHPILQTALPYSSHDFFKHFHCFTDKKPKDFRKKDFQKARTALKYLTRTAAKCSPLADFTTLGMVDLKQNRLLNAHTQHRINLDLFDFYMQQLTENELLRKSILIRKNPTLHLDSNEWCWILNIENQEHLQRTEDDELLSILFEFIENTPNCTFQKVQRFFLKQTGKAKQWQRYFEQLFEVGILEYSMPFSKNQKGFAELHNWLQQFDNQDDNINNLKKSLSWLLETVQNSSHINIDEWLSYCQYFNLKEARFRPESLFFKDVAHFEESMISIIQNSAPHLEIQTELYGLLAKALRPLYYDKLKHKISDFLAQSELEFPLSIFKLYEGVFHQEKEKQSQAIAESIKQNRLLSEKWLSQNIDFQEDTIYISRKKLQDFCQFTSTMEVLPLTILPKEINLVLQPSNDDSAILNGVSVGNGKQFLRFLHLFENESIITDFKLLETDELIFMELNDASLISANEHPAVANFALDAPNSLHQQDKISVLDLEICKSEEGAFYLRHKLTQKRVLPLDLGLEHPKRRSPLYQLLMAFGESLPDFRICNDLINNIYEQKYPEIAHYPRITLVATEHSEEAVPSSLFLQRKHWFFDASHLPNQAKYTSKLAYSKAMQTWANEKKLPSDIFVSIPFEMNSETNDFDRLRQDDYKPQYIDFENPLLIDLLGKILNRVPEVIKIEEMFPSPKQLFDFSGEKRVFEMVIQAPISPNFNA